MWVTTYWLLLIISVPLCQTSCPLIAVHFTTVRPIAGLLNWRCPAKCILATVTPNRSLFGIPSDTSLNSQNWLWSWFVFHWSDIFHWEIHHSTIPSVEPVFCIFQSVQIYGHQVSMMQRRVHTVAHSPDSVGYPVAIKQQLVLTLSVQWE